MRRLIAATTMLFVALGVIVGAAFAKQAAPASTKTVTVSYFTFSAAPDHLNTLKALIQIFEKKHPNIQISFQTAPYSDYFTKLQTQIAGGQAPDTFELDYGSFYGYATSGSLLNLSKAAKKDPSFKPSVYYPKAYQAFAVGKSQFGLPESFSDVLLF
jgi:multiple sugar transport system substrate-binding protein